MQLHLCSVLAYVFCLAIFRPSAAMFFPRCNIVVRCEVMWDLARSCANDDALLNKLPPCSRRQLCRCFMLPVIAKFDDGQKDIYIQLVTFSCFAIDFCCKYSGLLV